jgi:hypothetical protein
VFLAEKKIVLHRAIFCKFRFSAYTMRYLLFLLTLSSCTVLKPDSTLKTASNLLKVHVAEFNAYPNRPASDGHLNAKNNLAFLEENIPLLYTEDSALNKVYNYRWWMISKHLRNYPDPEDQKTYTVFTEFFGWKPWASRSGAIPCPAGHQFYDLRWLRNPEYLRSYIEYYMVGSASRLNQRENANFLTYLSRPESHHYSSWMIDGTAAYLKVHPQQEWLQQMYPSLERHQAVWDSLFTVKESGSSTLGMYKIMDLYDGMEFSLSAVLGLINSDKAYAMYTDSTWKKYYLGWGTTAAAANSPAATAYPKAFRSGYPDFYLVRPSINAYMYGNLKALHELSILLNSPSMYGQKAENLREMTLRHLWNEEDKFFHTVTAGDNTYGAKDYQARVRESVGYTPWYFGMIPAHSTYNEAWEQLGDSSGFYHRFGMTTAERRHPYYNEEAYAWNGRGWPFQNSMVIKAYGNYLRSQGKQSDALLDKQVAQLVALHGREELNIGEWYIPSRGPSFGGEKDYFHSSFPDLVIEDLIGFRAEHKDSFTLHPLLQGDFFLGKLQYRQREITLERKGKVIRVWVNGNLVAKSTKKYVKVQLPPLSLNH